jgi:PAT family beta-lactamase induction signal transducer AmpG
MTDAIKMYFKPRLITIFLFGFSSGLPLLLTLSTLSWWLSSVGVDKKSIGLFALVGAPYTFKPLWAPILDRTTLPLFGRLGRRRGWLLFIQLMLAGSIILMGHSDPANDLKMTAIFALMVSFWSASQDIVIDAYRIEALKKEEFTAGGGVEVFGYRMGMIIAGGVALGLSDLFSWEIVYLIMACFMSVGILTTLICKEPVSSKRVDLSEKNGLNWVKHSIIDPFLDFIKRPGWLLILTFIVFYRFGDNIIGQMATVFYRELGFTGTEVGTATKTFGIWMVVLGGLVGGSIGFRIGIMKTMLLAGFLHIISNGFFILLAVKGHSIPVLYMTVISENISSGIMTSAFVAYLSRLCNVSFSGTQYALFSSLMAVTRVFVQTSSGWLADHFGWVNFFIFASIAALPALFLLMYLMKKHPLD